MLFERFDPGARTATMRAVEEARSLGQEQVGTEHLLLATLADPDLEPIGEALGISYDAARRRIVGAVGVDETSGSASGQIPFDRKAVKALGGAGREAESAGSPRVGARHILLAIPDAGGRGALTLRELGVDRDRLRDAAAA